jgi:hypothetical protein
VLEFVEGVDRPVDADAAAGDDGQEGAHGLVVAVRGPDRRVDVAFRRAAGPVKMVPSRRGEVLDPQTGASAVPFAVRVCVEEGGLEVRGAVGPLARVALTDQVVLGAQLFGDCRGVGLDPAVVQERFAGLAGFADVDVAQLAGERVNVGEQPLMQIVEMG